MGDEVEDLKKEIKDLEADLHSTSAALEKMEWELETSIEQPLDSSIDLDTVEAMVYEAEGLKLEGREFGSWLLDYLKRFTLGF